MKIALILSVCVAVAIGRQIVKRQAAAAVLPDGVELIVPNLKNTFNCEGRIYGYYADPDNNCQVFHVCVPVEDGNGVVTETQTYSFFCGNQTVFDQQNLVCAHPEDATPCSDAPGLYDAVNRNFGVTEVPRS